MTADRDTTDAKDAHIFSIQAQRRKDSRPVQCLFVVCGGGQSRAAMLFLGEARLNAFLSDWL